MYSQDDKDGGGEKTLSFQAPAEYRPSSSRCSTLILSNGDDHFQLSNSHQKTGKLPRDGCEGMVFEEGGEGEEEGGREGKGRCDMMDTYNAEQRGLWAGPGQDLGTT